MYRTLQLALAGLIALVFGLSALSRRFPDVAWLQAFYYDPPRLSQEQRARMRRRANIHAGIELILVGIVLPMLYVAVTVMFFNDSQPQLPPWSSPARFSVSAWVSQRSGEIVEAEVERASNSAIRPTGWL